VTYRPFGMFRLLLALLVMCQHYLADLAPQALADAAAPFAFGGIAVLVFFALSGFVISEAIDCIYRGRAKAFLENRLLRIVPHFVLALALSMLAHALFREVGGLRLWRSQPDFPDDAFAPTNIVLNFVGIVPLADRTIPYNFLDITWALRVEMAFYLLAAFCILAARSRSYARVAGCMALGLTPLFVAALARRGIGTSAFGFLPYFVYGSALYFALNGRGRAWSVALICIPMMLFQCWWAPAVNPAPGAAPPSLVGNVAMLVVLLSIMTALAGVTLQQRKKLDRRLGDLTYPLYLYHEIILVVVLTFSATYSYTLLFAAMGISLGFAALMGAIVDPVIELYRDRVRGMRLTFVQSLPPGLEAPPSATLPAFPRGRTSVS
jgi:peptidoglycan/LPS O-acetylase OafA/YrhL